MKKGYKSRVFGISELAGLYFPNATKKSASNQLRRWITKSDLLHQQLQLAGYQKGQKILTPKQVELIFEYFGMPEDFSST
jgi:Domain of unknown function (DUF4248)